MIGTYEDATAHIANAAELRDLKNAKNLTQSSLKSGVGRGTATVQPLVITRILGHPELIFNQGDSKNTHFKVNAQARWTRMQNSECWICDQWKYCVVFFSRKNWKQHYSLITDEERTQKMQELYDLDQEDLLLVQNKDYPLVLGSITKNTVVSMTEVSMFNLFLDE